MYHMWQETFVHQDSSLCEESRISSFLAVFERNSISNKKFYATGDIFWWKNFLALLNQDY